MSVDKYFLKKFNRDNYNCLHFSVEVWKDVTGEDISKKLEGVLGLEKDRKIKAQHFKSFEKLDKPTDPCLVFFQRPRVPPHIGVYMRGKVLHILNSGVEFMPVDLAGRGCKTVKYYK